MRYQVRNSEFFLEPKLLGKLISSAIRERDRLVIALFAYTGIRRHELKDLKVEDISMIERRIIIKNGKGKKQRIVFYPEELNKILKDYLGGRKSGYLFFNKRMKPLSLRTINNIVAMIGKNAGIENPNPRYKNITPHLFRHSLARNWKREGGSLETLQKILGHESFQTTMDLYGTQSIKETEFNYRELSDKLVKN
jgi:integrase/recombinase XerD